MQFSSSVPSGQSCQPSHTDSSAWHSPFPQENSAGLQVSVKQEGPAWQGMGSSMGTGREQAGHGLGRADGGWPPCRESACFHAGHSCLCSSWSLAGGHPHEGLQSTATWQTQLIRDHHWPSLGRSQIP